MAERGSLVRLTSEFELELDWRGFELHPEIPVGGCAVTDIVPAAHVEAMHGRLQAMAAEHGAPAMTLNNWAPNTRRALATAEWARDHGALPAFRDAVMDAYWRDGRNIEADDVLRELATSVGLDPHGALRAADAPEYLSRIEQTRLESMNRGVTGIPTVFLGEHGLVGCQPYEWFRRLAVEARAVPRAAHG